MHITTFMIMRDLVATLERNHRLLRTAWAAGGSRASFDRLGRLTIHRALSTIELYEEDPLRERVAVGAMYAACDAGLRLLDLIGRMPACTELRKVQQTATRDLRRLVTELFDWLVIPSGVPMIEIEN